MYTADFYVDVNLTCFKKANIYPELCEEMTPKFNDS